MTEPNGMAVRVKFLEDEVKDLESYKASKETVTGLEKRMDRFELRLNNLTMALMTGAIAWLVGSGMFLVAVLQLSD